MENHTHSSLTGYQNDRSKQFFHSMAMGATFGNNSEQSMLTSSSHHPSYLATHTPTTANPSTPGFFPSNLYNPIFPTSYPMAATSFPPSTSLLLPGHGPLPVHSLNSFLPPTGTRGDFFSTLSSQLVPPSREQQQVTTTSVLLKVKACLGLTSLRFPHKRPAKLLWTYCCGILLGLIYIVFKRQVVHWPTTNGVVDNVALKFVPSSEMVCGMPR